ncbi:MAG: TraR/DksA C4-type zinc finger protein [Chitinophagaceae bacterium]|nr:TraR/DksA C4-type zinc finger protein [Bacteroidota bacterium]MCC6257461.1 TraR/DksA C4-type zinc finger protein [Chitinophagaceae bacterium]
MAVHKKTAKPAAKKVATKKPAAPAKKATKPAAKPAKPVAKASAKSAAKPAAKIVASKPVSKKATAKAPAKKVVAAKVAPKKAAPKPVVAHKQTPVKAKTHPVKEVKKTGPAKPAAPVAKPVAEHKPASKKVETKPLVAAKPAIPKIPRASISTKDIKVPPAKPVALPKINTKTARKYHPEFTKSVLDQPKHDLGAPIVRYSDADLKEFKELIMRKLEAAKKELTYLQGLITRKDELGGDESENRYMTMEDGSLSMEREQLSQMASRQITFIDHLEKALMRIENKTYGICRVTGKLIDKARLRAVPHATLSIEAKMGIVK